MHIKFGVAGVFGIFHWKNGFCDKIEWHHYFFAVLKRESVSSYCHAQSSQVWYQSLKQFQCYGLQKNAHYSIIYREAIIYNEISR